VSNIRLNHALACFRATDIKDFARSYPFSYTAEDWPSLKCFIVPQSRHPELDRWSDPFFSADGSADMHELLVSMTQTIRRTFKHAARHEKGIQDPIETLRLGSGSCRDLAMLMIALLRSRGIAARFVSGYLHLPDDDDDDFAGGNTHPFRGQAGSTSILRVVAWEMEI
jgi:transglutaminase-like putative cysteine protease